MIRTVPSHSCSTCDGAVSIDATSCSECGRPFRGAAVKHGEETCVILATIGAVLGFVVAFWGVAAFVERAFPESDVGLFARFALGIPATWAGTFLGVGPVARFCDALFAGPAPVVARRQRAQ